MEPTLNKCAMIINLRTLTTHITCLKYFQDFVKWCCCSCKGNSLIKELFNHSKKEHWLHRGVIIINNFFRKILRRNKKFGRFTNGNCFFKFLKRSYFFTPVGYFPKNIFDNTDLRWDQYTSFEWLNPLKPGPMWPRVTLIF